MFSVKIEEICKLKTNKYIVKKKDLRQFTPQRTQENGIMSAHSMKKRLVLSVIIG